jgi:pyrroloquinoline quinone biosynthesis protein D
MTTERKRIVITEHSRVALASYVTLREDKVRGGHVLLAPERVSTPSETAVEILRRCDGQRTVTDITRLLAADYDAPEADILTDVVGMLQELADLNFLAVAGGMP